jgi:hypothetical protein
LLAFKIRDIAKNAGAAIAHAGPGALMPSRDRSGRIDLYTTTSGVPSLCLSPKVRYAGEAPCRATHPNHLFT